MTKPASPLAPKNWRSLTQANLQLAILEALGGLAQGKSLAPPDIAKSLAADEWRGLLPAIKLAGGTLATAGDIEILRKGKPVAPEAARGVVRWRCP